MRDIYEIESEYQNALDSSQLLESPQYFRYDYSPNEYDSGRHPASHIHIGIKNNIRIGCKRVLNPISFISLILRHQYSTLWKNIILEKHKIQVGLNIKDSLKEISPLFIQEYDTYEMYLE